MAAFRSLWQSQVRSPGFPFPLLPVLPPWGRPCKAQTAAVSVLHRPLVLLCLPLPPRVRPWPPPLEVRLGASASSELGSTRRCAYCLWLFRGLTWYVLHILAVGCLQVRDAAYAPPNVNGYPLPPFPSACIPCVASKDPARRWRGRLSARPPPSPCYALPLCLAFLFCPVPGHGLPLRGAPWAPEMRGSLGEHPASAAAPVTQEAPSLLCVPHHHRSAFSFLLLPCSPSRPRSQ